VGAGSPGPDADQGDAGVLGEGGDEEGSVLPREVNGTVFTIPEGGGSITVTTLSGNRMTFQFPASAAELTVTLTPTNATSVGWPADQFDDVIKLEPAGTKFSDPVLVRPSSGDVLLVTFPMLGEKSAPELLALASAQQAFELRHFSVLAVVPPAHSCENDDGWSSAPSNECASFGQSSSLLSLSCAVPAYCLTFAVHCCVTPGTGGACHMGDDGLEVGWSPLTQSDLPAYCPRSADGGTEGGSSDAAFDALADAASSDAASDGASHPDAGSADAATDVSLDGASIDGADAHDGAGDTISIDGTDASDALDGTNDAAEADAGVD
jgi:hypothetical protein